MLFPVSISGSLTVLTIIAAISQSQQSKPNGQMAIQHKVDDPFPVLISLILCPIIPFLILGQRLRTKYSPQKLYIQLNSYFFGNTIPKWISKSRSFKKFLRNEYQK